MRAYTATRDKGVQRGVACHKARSMLYVVWYVVGLAIITAPPMCPTRIFTDRGCTQKEFTTHKHITSPDACCALCFALPNATCQAWTYHASSSECETAPYATIVFGKDKISGTFVPTPSPLPPTPKPPSHPTPPPIPAPKPHPPSGSQPNFVLVLQDDQDIYMGGWTPMKQSEELVAKRGATATNWFIHTPVCCPSRGEILTGRYFHSLRESTSGGGCMHIDTDLVNNYTFGTYLVEAGYSMAYFGKHLNNPPNAPPPGFSCSSCKWFAYNGDTQKYPNCKSYRRTPQSQKGCSGGGYFGSAFMDWVGGVPTPKDATVFNPIKGFYQADTGPDGEHGGYSASIINNKTIEWIRERAKAEPTKPWMAVVGNRAPHAPFLPAPWYAEGSGPASAWIDNLIAPRTPDYNCSGAPNGECTDFHWLIAQQDIITEKQANLTDAVFRNRWRALMSVDDGVAGIVAALDELSLAETTYIIITSDHGWNLGQHRLPGGKHNVYDHATRIPFVIRGPGIKAGMEFTHPASNVDVAPTLLGLAGVDELSKYMDGSSIVSLLIDPSLIDDVLPSTRTHLARHQEADAMRVAKGEAPKKWRTFHPIEFAGLNNHTWFDHLIDDVVSNTYRAMRYVNDAEYGDLLYAQFTGNFDWHFTAPSMHYELFNMTEDPHQLVNLFYTFQKDPTRKPMLVTLQKRLEKQWNCSASSCP